MYDILQVWSYCLPYFWCRASANCTFRCIHNVFRRHGATIVALYSIRLRRLSWWSLRFVCSDIDSNLLLSNKWWTIFNSNYLTRAYAIEMIPNRERWKRIHVHAQWARTIIAERKIKQTFSGVQQQQEKNKRRQNEKRVVLSAIYRIFFFMPNMFDFLLSYSRRSDRIATRRCWAISKFMLIQYDDTDTECCCGRLDGCNVSINSYIFENKLNGDCTRFHFWSDARMNRTHHKMWYSPINDSTKFVQWFISHFLNSFFYEIGRFSTQNIDSFQFWNLLQSRSWMVCAQTSVYVRTKSIYWNGDKNAHLYWI